MNDALLLLQELDLSPTASKAYLALLELGKASADAIAKKTNTYKANVYDALARLEEIGLVTTITEENKRLFVPTDPSKLDGLVLEQQEVELRRTEKLRTELKTILPQLHAKYSSIKEKDIFEVYRGRKAYKAIITEIVNEHPRFWKGFGNLQVQSMFPIEFTRWFKKIPIKLFSTRESQILARQEEAEKTTRIEIKWLPKEVYMPIVWVVFGNNVLIIIYEPEIIVLRIKSKQVVQTFGNQFDHLWKTY